MPNPIDSENVIAWLNAQIEKVQGGWLHDYGFPTNVIAALTDVKRFVKNLPTIEPEEPTIEPEVRHGEGCEYCKGRSYTKKPLTVTTRTMKRVEVCFNYCPNCGRDMRATGTNVGAKEVLTMAEPKLRNCPFCGGEPEAYGDKGFSLETGKEAWRYYIVCTGCTALVSGETEAEAAEYWNRRADNG